MMPTSGSWCWTRPRRAERRWQTAVWQRHDVNRSCTAQYLQPTRGAVNVAYTR